MQDGDAQARLEAGYAHEDEVAEELRSYFDDVVVGPRGWDRPPAEFLEPSDIRVGCHHVEAKKRNVRFSSIADYPFPTVFVGRCSRWDRRKSEPCASLIEGYPGRLVVPQATRRFWVVEECVDSISGKLERSYACPVRLCLPWLRLIRHLSRDHSS